MVRFGRESGAQNTARILDTILAEIQVSEVAVRSDSVGGRRERFGQVSFRRHIIAKVHAYRTKVE